MAHITLEWICRHPVITTVPIAFLFNRFVTAELMTDSIEKYITQLAVYIAIYFVILNVKISVDKKEEKNEAWKKEEKI